MSFQKNNLDLWINNQFGSEPLFLLVDGAQVEHDRISNLEHTYGLNRTGFVGESIF